MIPAPAIRVPVPDVSIVDLTVKVEKSTTKEAVNAAFKAAAETGRLKGYLAYTEDPVVSRDLLGNPASSILDAQLTDVMDGNLVKILAWYDNEWGYANRVVDLAAYIAKKEAVSAGA